MILSYHNEETETFANGTPVRRFAEVETIARRKIRQLQIAKRLEDLRAPLANRLENISGERGSRYRVRINRNFAVNFHWSASGASDVHIVEPHGARAVTLLASPGNDSRRVKPVSSGELLFAEFLLPMGVSQQCMAREIGVSVYVIAETIDGRMAMTPETDRRLSRYFGVTEGYWMRAQRAYDAEVEVAAASDANAEQRLAG